jgi:phage terminase large subunit
VTLSLPLIPASRVEAERRRRHWNRSIPQVYVPFFKKSRYKAAYSGRGAAKSYTFAEMLIQRHVDNPGTRSVCIREVQRSLEESCKRLIEDRIVALGVSDKFRILNTHIETPGNGIIIFKGMNGQTADTIKSLEGYDIAWVEEAQNLSEDSLDLLRPTLRKEGSELWFSWNPREATDAVDKFFRGDGAQNDDAIVIESNYVDNPYLSETMKKEIARDMKRDIDKFNHVWRGKYRKMSEARVFKNWHVEDFETPLDAVFLHGGDWGFSQDPTGLVRSFLRGERTLYVDREAFEVGCEINDTPDLFDSLTCGELCAKPRSSCKRPGHGVARNWKIIADSARPETISYMKNHGYPKIEPARKGAGSLEEGVKFLQSYDLVIHPRCKRTIDELTFYSYKVDEKTGQILPVLIDKKNHVIDSLRYTTEPLRKIQQAAFATW